MDLSNKYVITINRELGSGGKTVAKKLAEKLGVPYYDKAHLQSLEDREGVNADKIEHLKEKKRTWWPDLKKIVELDGGFFSLRCSILSAFTPSLSSSDCK